MMSLLHFSTTLFQCFSLVFPILLSPQQKFNLHNPISAHTWLTSIDIKQIQESLYLYLIIVAQLPKPNYRVFIMVTFLFNFTVFSLNISFSVNQIKFFFCFPFLQQVCVRFYSVRFIYTVCITFQDARSMMHFLFILCNSFFT